MLTTRSLEMIDSVAEAVLSLKRPGEEPVFMETGNDGKLKLVLGRYLPNDLSGMTSRFKGENRSFQLPTSEELLVKTKNAAFVDIQVSLLFYRVLAYCQLTVQFRPFLSCQ